LATKTTKLTFNWWRLVLNQKRKKRRKSNFTFPFLIRFLFLES
jgi:hypothetical protein